MFGVRRSIFVHWCPDCGRPGDRGSGKIKDPNAPWWKFWAEKVECPRCMGTGDRAYPLWPKSLEDLSRFYDALHHGKDCTYVARNGKTYSHTIDKETGKRFRTEVK